jgi:hypothetical protein
MNASIRQTAGSVDHQSAKSGARPHNAHARRVLPVPPAPNVFRKDGGLGC